MDEEIAEAVRKYGWYSLYVFDHDPPFGYTIGLMRTCGHPELIIFGLESDPTYGILAAMFESIQRGASFARPGTYSDVLEGADIGIRPVHESQHPLYMGFAWAIAGTLGSWANWKPCKSSGPIGRASSHSKAAVTSRSIVLSRDWT